MNIALGSPLLSRFDLIIVLLDRQNDDWDRIVSEFILSAELEKNDEVEAEELHTDPVSSSNNPKTQLWSPEKIQGYLTFVKTMYHPKLSDESMDVLKRYYQLQRSTDMHNNARTTIRLLESLIRLAQAHVTHLLDLFTVYLLQARLMCQQEVSIMDAVSPPFDL